MAEAFVTIVGGIIVLLHVGWFVFGAISMAIDLKNYKMMEWGWLYDNDFAMCMIVLDAFIIFIVLSAIVGSYLFKLIS